MDIDPIRTIKGKNKSYRNKVEDFKKPKTTKAIFAQSREERMNRNSQMRKNKINEHILKKRGLIDSDGHSSVEISKNKSMSLSNLTQLIDLTAYKIPPKIVALVALNADVDLDSVMSSLNSIITDCHRINNNSWTGVVPANVVKGKQRLTFIKTDREAYNILDTSKIADIVLFVSSCKRTDYSKWKTDPDKFSHAIDEFGYKMLSMIRAQGLPEHICLLQHLGFIPEKYRTDIKKLFTRYFESELIPQKIFSTVDDGNDVDEIKAIIRQNCSFGPSGNLELRKHRSYMLCERIEAGEDNTVNVYGYIRGNTFNTNKYIHLTGFGDYYVTNIDVYPDPVPTQKNHLGMEMEIEGNSNTKNSLHKNKNKENETHDEMVECPTGLGGKIIGGGNFISQNKNNVVDEEIIDFDIDIKDDEDEDLSFEENNEEEEEGKISRKHLIKTGLQYRTPDEMEFPDEVDTPIDVPARERFHKYRGLSSMKNGSWDPMEDLPKEYNNIYSFENLKHLYKQAVKKSHEEGMKLSGHFVKVTLKDFNKEELKYYKPDYPLVLSTLLEHERKICVMNYKVSLNFESKVQLKNKMTVESQVGFRRYLIRPIFSNDFFVGCDKLKKEKRIEKDKFYICSVYSQLTYSNSPVLFLRPHEGQPNLVASGTTLEADSKKIILKRIILTGYPIKIKKKKAVVRYMFLNPVDIHYFKPIQLTTKNGLRGHITQSIGTHGHMKCVFNDHIKASDTICMYLYKRVFPVWFKESWRYKVFYGNREDYMSYFNDDEEKKQKEILQENTNANMMIDI